jgi:DNA-binding transcriptional MocR family regulator
MLLTLDSSLHKPLYVQIRDQIREHIAAGVLKGGDRLESSRELAKRLGVHRTTVGNAYAELEAEGLIEGSVGRGTFISRLAMGLVRPLPPMRRPTADIFWDSFLADESGEFREDGLGRLMASASEAGAISFATSHAPADLIPLDIIRRVVDRVLRRDGAKLLQYGPSDGYPPLKKYLQTRLRRDGINAELDEILITNGCQQSLDLVRRSLVAAGDTVACENPTYTGLRRVFESSGTRLIGIPVNRDGMDLDVLEAVLEQNKVKLILTSPNFQNPTGRVMPRPARERLLELAGRFQAPVAEDDIYGALRYRGREMGSLKSLDRAGMVIYLNSFSKIGFPGLRVGWIVASRRVIERLQFSKQRADLHTNLLGQAVLEELGCHGHLDKLVRRVRKVCEQKLEALEAAIQRHFPNEVQCEIPEGGMSVWVTLPEGIDSDELLVKARDRGVIFAPSRYFYLAQAKHNAFRLCFTAATHDEIERGVGIMGALLAAEMRKHVKARGRAAAGAGMALV